MTTGIQSLPVVQPDGLYSKLSCFVTHLATNEYVIVLNYERIASEGYQVISPPRPVSMLVINKITKKQYLIAEYL